jgi:hypothetical protein
MTTESKGLFITTGNGTTEVNGVRRLRGTAQLVTESDNVALTIIDEIKTDPTKWAEKVQAAKKSHEGAFALIDEIVPNAIEEAELSFLADADDDELNAMLKSQQSKKSRAASKLMTVENFKEKISATAAEKFIRHYYKPATVRASKNDVVDFTDDELQAYSDDQELLRRALRNVQSKKSIMKSRVDFDANSDRWQALLKAEHQLKERRLNGQGTSNKDELRELMETVDVENLKAADSKELLAKIASLIK